MESEIIINELENAIKLLKLAFDLDTLSCPEISEINFGDCFNELLDIKTFTTWQTM